MKLQLVIIKTITFSYDGSLMRLIDEAECQLINCKSNANEMQRLD